MPLSRINAPKAHKVKAALSHAVRVGDLLFVSGTPGSFGNREYAVGDFPAQFKQAMANIREVLDAAGTGFDRVAKVNVILTRTGDFWVMDELYRQYFPAGAYPARTTIIAGLAIPEMLLEIEMVAEV